MRRRGSAAAAAVAVTLAVAAPWAQARAPARIVYLEPARAMLSKADAATQHERLSFEAFGKRFDLQLEPNRRIAAAIPANRPDLLAYEGGVAGLPDSWARITRGREGLSGIVYDGRELYAIEPARSVAPIADAALTPPASGTVVYRLEDALIDAGAISCGVEDAAGTTGLDLYKAIGSQFAALAAGAAGKQLDVAMVADYELYQVYGAATVDFMVARINVVDGIYAAQLGLRIRVGSSRIFDTPQEPFTASAAPDLLQQLAGFRRTTIASQRLGLTHLMSGRELDDTTVGIAYLDTICSLNSASLTEARAGKLSATVISLISAHEIGHNFGAPHDGEAGKACAGTSSTAYLMAPSLSAANTQFSQCSLAEISQRIANALCLTDVDQADLELVAPVATARHGLDVSYTLTFTVRSVGTRTADLASVAFTIPPGSTLESINAAGGSCTSSGTGQANCSLGSLPSGTTRTVTLALTGRVFGTATLTGSVFAANDGAPGNNAVSVQIVTDPVANLATRISVTPASLELGDDTQVTVTISNGGPADAADARLSVDIPTGLTVGAIDTTLVCSGSANSVSCEPASLAMGAERSLSFTAHATTAGSRTISALVLSSAIDPDNADNSASAVVSVSDSSAPPAPPPPSSGASGGGGGGGGGLLPGWLAVLALVLVLRISRSRRAVPWHRLACPVAPAARESCRRARHARRFPFSSLRA